MSTDLPSDAERFLLALAQLPSHEWVEAAAVRARARRSLMFAEARASLRAVFSAAPDGSADPAVAAEITHRIEEAVRAVSLVVGTRVVLWALPHSATAAALACAFRERLTPADVASPAVP